jgi:uncharacterized protein
MSLEQQINDDIKSAMLSKDREKLESLRAVKAALLLEKTKEGTTGEIPETVEVGLLRKLVKQRKESAGIYQAQNRKDLADAELFQASIIEKYLPKSLSDEEIMAKVKEIIAETGAASAKDMGKVMGAATKAFAGQADNKVVSEMVKKLLGA